MVTSRARSSRWALALGVAALLLPGVTRGQDEEPRLDVRVLYAGVESSPRTEEFRHFLQEHFVEVGTLELKDLTAEGTRGYDVVLVDTPSPYSSGEFQMPAVPELGPDYTRPTLLMGAAGGSVLQKLKPRCKMGWL